MNNVKTKFSIKDLENLSGIKAHTIRIWEKRYNLFTPDRTETNIRYYSLKSLQKILNISYLNNNGYKISKIAKLNKEEISDLVNQISEENSDNNNVINQLKMAMFKFDSNLFNSIYTDLKSHFNFEQIFYNYLIPFLDNIGMLWQTDTITPAHEHFIVELIKQKLMINTELSDTNSNDNDKKEVFILFLPLNEIHELGILFINYLLVNHGYHSVYLGQSVPVDSLEYLKDFYKKIIFISNFTVKPEIDEINTYVEELDSKLIENTANQLYLYGRQLKSFEQKDKKDSIKIFDSIEQIISFVEPATVEALN